MITKQSRREEREEKRELTTLTMGAKYLMESFGYTFSRWK